LSHAPDSIDDDFNATGFGPSKSIAPGSLVAGSHVDTNGHWLDVDTSGGKPNHLSIVAGANYHLQFRVKTVPSELP
jgi:hypothetical protein